MALGSAIEQTTEWSCSRIADIVCTSVRCRTQHQADALKMLFHAGGIHCTQPEGSAAPRARRCSIAWSLTSLAKRRRSEGLPGAEAVAKLSAGPGLRTRSAWRRHVRAELDLYSRCNTTAVRVDKPMHHSSSCTSPAYTVRVPFSMMSPVRYMDVDFMFSECLAHRAIQLPTGTMMGS